MNSFRVWTVLIGALWLGTSVASAQPPGETAFRAMFREMVETDTSSATGDCTILVNKIATRMTAAGFPAGQLHVFVPEGAP